MKEVRQGTQKANQMLHGYRYYPSCIEHGLHTIYKSYSSEKEQAYYDCLKRARYYGTIKDVKACGSTYNFSLYICVDCGENEQILIHETSSNTFILKGVNL